MRDLGVIGAMFLIGGVAVWMITNYYRPARASAGVSANTLDTKAAAKATVKPPGAANGGAISAGAGIDPAVEAREQEGRVPEISMPAKVRVPTLQQTMTRVYWGDPATIPIGTQEDQLDDLVGPPDLETTAVDHGSTEQVYVYHRQPGTNVYLHILDGRVVGNQPLR